VHRKEEEHKKVLPQGAIKMEKVVCKRDIRKGSALSKRGILPLTFEV